MGVKNWSAEEVEYLEESWGNLSVAYIAKRLGRTPTAINIKKDKLGLGPYLDAGDYVPYRKLMQVLGDVNYDVYKNVSWVKERGFPVKYKRIHGKHRFRVVYLSDFWKWAEQNRSMINWASVEENILGEEPAWVKLQRRVDYYGKAIYKGKNTPWTQEEILLLVQLLKQHKYTYIDLVAKLKRNHNAIQRKIYDLGLKERPIQTDSHNYWTKEDVVRLEQMILQGYSYELMSVELSRTAKAIRGAVRRKYGAEKLDKVRRKVVNGYQNTVNESEKLQRN